MLVLAGNVQTVQLLAASFRVRPARPRSLGNAVGPSIPTRGSASPGSLEQLPHSWLCLAPALKGDLVPVFGAFCCVFIWGNACFCFCFNSTVPNRGQHCTV